MSEIHRQVLDYEELRPTHVQVDLDQLVENYHQLCRHTKTAVMPVLKANAYGHGLVPVARAMEEAGAPILAVAYLEEGTCLRKAGIKADILVLGGICVEQIPRYLQYNLILTAASESKLVAINDAAALHGERAAVHLKIDTGMERLGVHWSSCEPLLQAVSRCTSVDVCGVFTHFANSDSPDRSFTNEQMRRFETVMARCGELGIEALFHSSNSGAILQFPRAHLDMVRAGILLYGYRPSTDIALTVPVKPALKWVTRVVYFKVVQGGCPISYGSTFTPQEWIRAVTLPVGYGDGYFRCMSGHAQVLIRGERFSVVGRICMDQIVVNIGRKEAFNGDEVVLLGEQGGQQISAEHLACWANTITYEVLTNINSRVPRVYCGANPRWWANEPWGRLGLE